METTVELYSYIHKGQFKNRSVMSKLPKGDGGSQTDQYKCVLQSVQTGLRLYQHRW